MCQCGNRSTNPQGGDMTSFFLLLFILPLLFQPVVTLVVYGIVISVIAGVFLLLLFKPVVALVVYGIVITVIAGVFLLLLFKPVVALVVYGIVITVIAGVFASDTGDERCER
jgi:hypothetical protein